jgi:pilus assembly protein CpaC
MNRTAIVMKTSGEKLGYGFWGRNGMKCVALAVLVVAQFLLSASAQEKGAEINLVVGEVKTLSSPPNRKIVRIGIGNGKLFNAKVLEKEGGLIFIPENPGRTNLIIWTADGASVEHSVSVLPANVETTIDTINKMLKGINNVRAERAGDTILITGSTTKVNMPRIEGIAKSFPSVFNAVRDEELEMKRMVYMRVQIVEMKKSLSENLGVKWDQSLAGPTAGLVATVGVGSYNNPGPQFRPGVTVSGLPSADTIPTRGYGWKPVVGMTSIITSTINLAVNNGDAFVLATPELSTRSGGKAEFLAGGQVPIVSPASGTQPASVQFKDYGIKLSIEPVTDDKGNVSTSLDTEISSIDNSVAVMGNPGFLTRKTKSQFNVQEGQTIVISGLVNTELAKDLTKLAGLGNLPILGALFRSNNFRSGRTDLVILVTPTVVDPSAEAVKKVSDIENSAKKFAADEGLLIK